MEGELFIMLINIHDSHLEKVGFLDSESPGAPSFFNDVEHHYLAEGASTFTFSVNKKKNGILQDYCQFLNEDAYFSFSEHGDDHFYSVGTVDEDNDTTFTVTCYSLNLELRLEQCEPLENTASHNIQWYFDQMGLINNTQITIGINEVSDLSRVIKYDGQESKLARLISLIGNFDAEFEFITKSNNDGTLDKIILNIYKENDGVNFQGVGTNRDDVILTLDTNITGVSRTVDKTQIFNATTITGADGLNWNSSEFSYVNSDGVEEFYKRKNADTAFAPLSLAKYPSQIQSSTGDRWIRKNFTTDYTSANAIWGYAVSQFKKFAYGIITYKVSVSSLLVSSEVGNSLPLKIGDTVTISDDNFIDSNGVRGLILSARVSEMEISRTDPTKNTLVFSNYIRLQSQISNDLKSQLSNLVDAATPYIGSIDTTNGTQFKNGTGSTTLSAHIFKGSATTEATADSYEWSKDGTVVANVQTITVDASGVADKAVYSFKATVAGKAVASQSVTITNVDDGTNGRSVTNVSQKWRLTTTTATPTQAWSDAGWLTTQPTTTATNKYLWSITRTTFNLAPLTQDVIEQKAVYGDKGDKGDTGNDGRAGKDGVGLRSTTVTYTISSSGTVTPTTGWTSQVPTLVKGQYLWTKTVWNYSDGTSESGYTVSYIAKDGNNGNDGIAGKDGVGITATTITYAQSTSGTIAPSSGWTSTVPTVAEGSYLWTKTVWTYSDSTSETGYSVAMNGKTPYFYTAWSYSADGTDGFTTVYPNLNLLEGTKDFSGDWWSRENWENDGTYKGLSVKRKVGSWGGITKQFIAPKDGVYTFSAYVKSSAGESSHVQLIVSLNDKRIKDEGIGSNFDWLRNSFQVTLKTGDRIYAQYNMTSSGTLWTAGHKWEEGSVATPHMPSASEAKTSDWPSYIGKYTDFTQADSTNPSDYTWSLIRGNDGKDGADGHDGRAGKDGVGIKTTVITYAISISGTTAPSTGWTSSVPTLVKGQYLWTKTVWTYTDSSSETGYSVTYIAKDGNNGNDGIAGKDGVGIKTTTITYAGSTSGTKAPSSGWTSTVPSVPAGQFLWTKTVWTYTDNSFETGYSVAMMGVKGDKGDQGPTGPAGSDGNPGKVIQQNTEPTNKFLDMLWQYTGTEPLNATGITVLSNIIYVWNGTAWQIWLLNPQNIQAVNAWITNAMIGNAAIKLANIDTATITELSAVTATLGDVEAGSITNDISYGFVAQGNHHYLGNSVINYRGINISETMTLDNVLQYTQSMGFDAITGLFFQRLSENQDIISSIRLIEVGNNEMGLYVGNATESATLTSKGLTLSTDVPWTILSPMGGFSGGSIQFSVQNGVEFFSIAGLSVPQMNANQWYQATSLPAGSIAIPSINRVYPISGNNNAWDLLINSAGGVFIRCQAAVSATSNLVNGGCGFPIG
jgi:hypothetical protein